MSKQCHKSACKIGIDINWPNSVLILIASLRVKSMTITLAWKLEMLSGYLTLWSQIWRSIFIMGVFDPQVMSRPSAVGSGLGN